MLTDLLGLLLQWQVLVSLPQGKHHITLRSLHIYTHENVKILQLHNFSLKASWSTECRLTQREFFASFLLDVATLRRYKVVTLLRIYMNEGKIKIEQHLFGQKSQNTNINSERKRLSCRVEGGDAHWRLYRLPVVTGVEEPEDSILANGTKT